MPVDYKDFLISAKALPSDTEINNRNASSRAYYSAYHICRSVFGNPYDPTVKAGAHEQLIQYLLNSKEKSEISLGYQMRHIKAIRTTADYELDAEFSENDRVTTISYVTKIINKLDSDQANPSQQPE